MRSLSMVCALAAVGACGGNGVHHLADSSIDTPMIDAETFDGPIPGMVSVIVTLQGVPTANVPVYFQNADSTLVGSAEVLTDDTGTASAVMLDGGFVTVLEPQSLGTAATPQVLATFAGVVQNDVLHDDVDPVATTSVDTVQLAAPVDKNAATSTYELLTTCPASDAALGSKPIGSNLAPTSVNLEDCSVGDMVVETFNANGGPLDFLFDANVPVSNGSSILLAGTYAPVVAQAFAYTDVPPEYATVDVEAALLGPNGRYDLASKLAFSNTTGSGSATLALPGGGSSVTAAFETELLPPNGAAVTDQQALVSWGPVPGAAIAIDVGSARLRDWVTQPQLDAQTEQLTWSVENTGIVPDYVVAEVTDSRTGSAGTTTWDWLIAGGGNEDGAIAYPTLPTDIFDFNFHDTDTLNVNLLGGAQTPGGYDTARPLVFDDLGLVAGDPTGLASPGTTGTAVVQQLHRVLTLPAAVRAHHHRPRHAYRTRR